MNNIEDIKHLQTYEGKTVKKIELCIQKNNKNDYCSTGIKIIFMDNTFIHLFDWEQYGMGITTNKKDISIKTDGEWDEFEDQSYEDDSTLWIL